MFNKHKTRLLFFFSLFFYLFVPILSVCADVNWSENVTFPKITDVLDGSNPPNILQLGTYTWIWFLGGWFFAAFIGGVGVALYMKYENVIVTVVFCIVMFILLGGTSGIFFTSSGSGLPDASIFVYIIGIFSAFAIGSLLYKLFVKGE